VDALDIHLATGISPTPRPVENYLPADSSLRQCCWSAFGSAADQPSAVLL